MISLIESWFVFFTLGILCGSMEVLWQFSRPHTIVATSISLVSLQLLAILCLGREGDYVSFGWAWLACLAANVAIVGINQITDIEIDRINKPSLPLPSGTLTLAQAWQIVGVAMVVGLGVGGWRSPYLLGTISLSLLLGLGYSLPPLRFKRFALWSAFCIVAVRGAIVNLGLFVYFAKVPVIPPAVWLLTGFMVVFGMVIAICKDVPDTEGDRQFQIETFSLRWGREVAIERSQQLLIGLFITCGLLGLIYLGWLFAVAMLVCAAIIWQKLPAPDPQVQSSIAQFYQRIWRLFYVAYLLFPLGLLPTKLP